jgi:hypothetical protein
MERRLLCRHSIQKSYLYPGKTDFKGYLPG